MKPTIGILVFPGSNCDHDAYHALSNIMDLSVEMIWHKESDIKNSDLIFIPGGFSYGDYLRSGAIARFSPIMESVIKFANEGGPVLGVCNGFQILLEAGLLPGAMLHNQDLRFVCKTAYIRTENSNTLFTRQLNEGQVLDLPVAHGEGNYFIDEDGLKELQDNDQIVFRYSDVNGNLTKESNFNGSTDHIAGICNQKGNVMGMMPHPERAVESLVSNQDGLGIFSSMINALATAEKP